MSKIDKIMPFEFNNPNKLFNADGTRKNNYSPFGVNNNSNPMFIDGNVNPNYTLAPKSEKTFGFQNNNYNLNDASTWSKVQDTNENTSTSPSQMGALYALGALGNLSPMQGNMEYYGNSLGRGLENKNAGQIIGGGLGMALSGVKSIMAGSGAANIQNFLQKEGMRKYRQAIDDVYGQENLSNLNTMRTGLYFAEGGEMPQEQQITPEMIIQAYAQMQGMNEQQMGQLMQELQNLSPEEQQQAIQEMAQVVQQAQQQMAQEQAPAPQEEMPQEQMAPEGEPMMSYGGKIGLYAGGGLFKNIGKAVSNVFGGKKLNEEQLKSDAYYNMIPEYERAKIKKAIPNDNGSVSYKYNNGNWMTVYPNNRFSIENDDYGMLMGTIDPLTGERTLDDNDTTYQKYGAQAWIENRPIFAGGGKISRSKAKEILHEGTIGGKPITDKQRRYFGAMSNMAGGGEYVPNTFLPTPDPNLAGYEYDPTLVAGTFDTNVAPVKNNYVYKNAQGNLIGYSTDQNPNMNNDILLDSSQVQNNKYIYKDKNGNVIGIGNENTMYGKEGNRRVGMPIYGKGGEVDKVYIKEYQRYLNEIGATDNEGKKLKIDGIMGPRTKSAAKKSEISYDDFYKEMNSSGNDEKVYGRTQNGFIVDRNIEPKVYSRSAKNELTEDGFIREQDIEPRFYSREAQNELTDRGVEPIIYRKTPGFLSDEEIEAGNTNSNPGMYIEQDGSMPNELYVADMMRQIQPKRKKFLGLFANGGEMGEMENEMMEEKNEMSKLSIRKDKKGTQYIVEKEETPVKRQDVIDFKRWLNDNGMNVKIDGKLDAALLMKAEQAGMSFESFKEKKMESEENMKMYGGRIKENMVEYTPVFKKK